MPKFAICAAMMTALLGLSASVPANAEYWPGPTHRNDGKCFTFSRFQVRDGAFGFWSDCAKSREFGCSESGLTKFGYFGGCEDKGGAKTASAKNNARRRPATASR
jgi:hypothetical protein